LQDLPPIYPGDPITHHVVDLFHPRQHRWQAHFTWDERFERIIGLTATGRAMVEHGNSPGQNWCICDGYCTPQASTSFPQPRMPNQADATTMLIGENSATLVGEKESEKTAYQQYMLAKT
jgi:hypothetical protein